MNKNIEKYLNTHYSDIANELNNETIKKLKRLFIIIYVC